MSHTTTIPVIDIGAFVDAAKRADSDATAASLGAAFRDVGFAYITGHGVPSAVIQKAFSHAKRLFELPMDAKEALSMTGANAHTHRGYSGFGDEVLNEETKDWKEAFDIGYDLPPSDPDVAAGVPLHGPNVWPSHESAPELATFKHDLELYFSHMERVGRSLLVGFEKHFGLADGYFEPFFQRPLVLMRLLHYPPLPEEMLNSTTPGRDIVTCGEHSDYGGLTLLAVDAPGLQVKSTNGEWIAAPPMGNDALIVNLGDMMQRWTNDVLKATPHRVVNVNPLAHRYSIPFFFEPNFHSIVRCLEPCLRLSGTTVPKYPDTQYGPYLLSRYDATFNHRKDDESNPTNARPGRY
ncbi:2OG-Fe(II) oxygenase [Capsaspora owczarzaki ATCC 30864]|nr:2OG-Fe(II) oxygenase [Capsaspora owczarzaki ATCC 30864]|eukprot:XP_004364535.1 2OG-Fe(II) oxygenase [Capsaspora owczarzaki ATCC 30864]